MINELKQANLTLDDAKVEIRHLETRVAALSATVDRLEKIQRLTDIGAYLKARARKRAANPVVRRLFTIDLLCLDGDALADVTRPELYLDDKGLDAHYADTLPQVGAIRRVEVFLNGLTFRLCSRLAQRYAERLKLPFDLVREAWFQSVMMEVWHLVSARHIARRIARAAAGEPVIIPITATSFPYLSHGAESRKIDRFYLAAELQRCGVPVVFVCAEPDIHAQARAGTLKHLRFEPHKDLWVPKPLPSAPPEPIPGARAVVLGSGIRGIAQILKRCPDALRVQSGYVFDPAFGAPEIAVTDPGRLPVALTFPLHVDDEGALPGDDMILLSTTLNHTDLGEYMLVAMGGATAVTTGQARELAERYNLMEAHVCDHAFYESAIVANVVKERGGRVVLWPHSFNPAVPEFRRPGTVDEVNCVTESGAKLWRAQLPDAKVSVIPNFWLPPYHGPKPASNGDPLTVVVICNEYGYAGVDHMNRWILEISYRRLLRRLPALAPEVRYVVRPRSQANLNWVWRIAGRPQAFPHTQDPPLLIDHPNMVFLFVGLMSSAIFEGICRGIPALYLREDPTVAEYVMPKMPDCLPTGDIPYIEQEIQKCCDASYRDALIRGQADWYRAEIGS